jgi:hypothetical protein
MQLLGRGSTRFASMNEKIFLPLTRPDLPAVIPIDFTEPVPSSHRSREWPEGKNTSTLLTM